MELEFRENRIIFSKELSKLDILAVRSSKILSGLEIGHVFLSGYIAILFGRNRASEDIDVVCESISIDKYRKLWAALHEDLECIITDEAEDSYNKYLMNNTALRFANKNELIPNIELKYARTELHNRALLSPLIVELNENTIPISPLEQQIAYKLFMTSEKDIEDARFIFKLFEEHLNKQKLIELIEELEVDPAIAKTHLGWRD